MSSKEKKVKVADMVRAAMTGDENAIADLLNEFEDTIRKTLAKTTELDCHDSEVDIMHQEVCFRIWRYLNKSDPLKFAGWVKVISRNVGYTWIKRQAKPPLKDLVTSTIDVYDNWNLEAPQIDQSTLQYVLDSLPEKHRRCIYSQFVLGQSEREQGAEEGLAGGTINYWRAKAIAAAKELLENEVNNG